MVEDIDEDKLLWSAVLKVSKSPPKHALYITLKLSDWLENVSGVATDPSKWF